MTFCEASTQQALKDGRCDQSLSSPPTHTPRSSSQVNSKHISCVSDKELVTRSVDTALGQWAGLKGAGLGALHFAGSWSTSDNIILGSERPCRLDQEGFLEEGALELGLAGGAHGRGKDRYPRQRQQLEQRPPEWQWECPGVCGELKGP